jgi:hypothetical protein
MRTIQRPGMRSFTFDQPLEDPSLAWDRWEDRGFLLFESPREGGQIVLPGAVLPMDLL